MHLQISLIENETEQKKFWLKSIIPSRLVSLPDVIDRKQKRPKTFILSIIFMLLLQQVE